MLKNPETIINSSQMEHLRDRMSFRGRSGLSRKKNIG